MGRPRLVTYPSLASFAATCRTLKPCRLSRLAFSPAKQPRHRAFAERCPAAAAVALSRRFLHNGSQAHAVAAQPAQARRALPPGLVDMLCQARACR